MLQCSASRTFQTDFKSADVWSLRMIWHLLPSSVLMGRGSPGTGGIVIPWIQKYSTDALRVTPISTLIHRATREPNVSSVARPSCEKVLAALHLGEVSLFLEASRLVPFALQFNLILPKSSLSDSPPPPWSTLPQPTSPPHQSSNTPSSRLCGEEAAAVPYTFRAGEMVHVFTSDLSPSAAGAQAQVGHPAFTITFLCIYKEALPLWALSMLAGLSIVVDFLPDNTTLNLRMGIVHVLVLKALRLERFMLPKERTWTFALDWDDRPIPFV
ncbi:hypothetical protein EDB84DRAFT_1565754 [Lactarius hengduanensis]|nr:hypothetical protein EDB84DRAFT_1565754 [Lactarius hengduanensis]